MSDVADSIRRYRKAKKLSQEKLAGLAGVDQNLISSYECGRTQPNARMVLRLCAALDVSPNQFLDWRTAMSEQPNEFAARKCRDDGCQLVEVRIAEIELDAHTKEAFYGERIEELEAKCERLRAGVRAVADLINESLGVVGLHLNGDTADWEELRAGGKYESWLYDFDMALTESGDE